MDSNPQFLEREIKAALIDNLMLREEASEMAANVPLFEPGGLGLDSVDALQIEVLLHEKFEFKAPEGDARAKILYSIETIADAIRKKRAACDD